MQGRITKNTKSKKKKKSKQPKSKPKSSFEGEYKDLNTELDSEGYTLI